MVDSADEDATWLSIRHGSQQLLSRVGTENAFGEGDFWVLDDYWNNRENLIYVTNPDLLQPSVVLGLQALLKELPDWAIVVAVDVTQKGLAWPPMGLTIHRHEIVDELRREYLPPQLHDLHYPGARTRDPSHDPERSD